MIDDGSPWAVPVRSANRAARLLLRFAAGATLSAIALASAPGPVAAIVVRVPCEGCSDWPIWLQAGVTLVGVLLAMAVLYVPYRLSRRARTPQQRARIVVGGVLLATIGLVVGARLLVMMFPG